MCVFVCVCGYPSRFLPLFCDDSVWPTSYRHSLKHFFFAERLCLILSLCIPAPQRYTGRFSRRCDLCPVWHAHLSHFSILVSLIMCLCVPQLRFFYWLCWMNLYLIHQYLDSKNIFFLSTNYHTEVTLVAIVIVVVVVFFVFILPEQSSLLIS